jgi:hypothetical protein
VKKPLILPKALYNGNRFRSFIDSPWGLCYPPYMINNCSESAAFASHTSDCTRTTLPNRRATGRAGGFATTGLVLSCILSLAALSPSDGFAKTKPSRAPRPEPELKILDLRIAPTPYEAGNGPLEFSVNVQLPKELNGATVLEVSSLISSPSKTSLRFLTHRQALQPQSIKPGEARTVLPIRLSWDGQDHRKQLAGPGTYAYEVRIKLLANGEKGLRTMMVAWPKRGELTVK